MSNATTDQQKWEEFLHNGEGLMEEYQKLLNKVKYLEAAKAALEEKLRTSEAQKEELQQKLSSISHALLRELVPPEEQAEVGSKWAAEIRELRASISRLLKYPET